MASVWGQWPAGRRGQWRGPPSGCPGEGHMEEGIENGGA